MVSTTGSSSRRTTQAPVGSAKSGRQAKAAALQAAARRREQRRKLTVRAGIGLGAAAVAGGVAVLAVTTGSSGSPAAPSEALPTVPAATGAGLPPWPVPTEPRAGIKAAGLQVSSMEGTATHFHPHLDILIDGAAVPVTADIGISPTTGTMSELHTHDTSGVVHIESPTADKRYTLGQLFTEWGVRLDAAHLGSLSAAGGRTLTAYVDGEPVAGNPAQVELLAHREIALVFGSPDQQVDVPSSYDFPKGE